LPLLLLEVVFRRELGEDDASADRAVRTGAPGLRQGVERRRCRRQHANADGLVAPAAAEGIALQVRAREPPLGQLVAGPLVRFLPPRGPGQAAGDSVGERA